MTSRLPTPRDPDPAGGAGPDHAGGSLDADRAAELAAQLRVLKQQRVADEREAGALPSVLRAIVMTRRDRDAESSPTLRGHREQLERVFTEIEDLFATAAGIAVRLQVRGGDTDDPLARRAKRAIDASVQAVGQWSRRVQQTL